MELEKCLTANVSTVIALWASTSNITPNAAVTVEDSEELTRENLSIDGASDTEGLWEGSAEILGLDDGDVEGKSEGCAWANTVLVIVNMNTDDTWSRSYLATDTRMQTWGCWRRRRWLTAWLRWWHWANTRWLWGHGWYRAGDVEKVNVRSQMLLVRARLQEYSLTELKMEIHLVEMKEPQIYWGC